MELKEGKLQAYNQKEDKPIGFLISGKWYNCFLTEVSLQLKKLVVKNQEVPIIFNLSDNGLIETFDLIKTNKHKLDPNKLYDYALKIVEISNSNNKTNKQIKNEVDEVYSELLK